MKDQENYRRLAALAREDADRANLANVRDRCLRAEAAWIIMAERAERNERLRTAHEIAKAHEAAKAAEALAQVTDPD